MSNIEEPVCPDMLDTILGANPTEQQLRQQLQQPPRAARPPSVNRATVDRAGDNSLNGGLLTPYQSPQQQQQPPRAARPPSVNRATVHRAGDNSWNGGLLTPYQPPQQQQQPPRAARPPSVNRATVHRAGDNSWNGRLLTPYQPPQQQQQPPRAARPPSVNRATVDRAGDNSWNGGLLTPYQPPQQQQQPPRAARPPSVNRATVDRAGDNSWNGGLLTPYQPPQQQQGSTEPKRKRLERLQRLAEEVHRDIKNTHGRLEGMECRIEAVSRRLDGLHPLDVKRHVNLLEEEMKDTDRSINRLFNHVKALGDGRYPQAGHLHKRVQSARQRWVAVRSLLHTKLITALASMAFLARERTQTVMETTTEWCWSRLESQQRVSEYREISSSLHLWIREKIALMQDRNFPQTLIEMKKLSSESSRFRNDEVPPRQIEKQKLSLMFRELEKYFQAGGEVNVDWKLHFHNLEKNWNFLMMAHQERDLAMTEEIKRLERLQRLAEEVHRHAEQTHGRLEGMECRVEAVSRRLDGLHPLDVKRHVDLLEDDIKNTDRSINRLGNEVKALGDGRYPQAGDLHKRVQSARQRWVAVRSLLHTKLITALASMAFQASERTQTVMEATTEWCRSRLL